MPRTPAKILTPEEQEARRLKKNADLKAWRQKHKEDYRQYMKRWHDERRAERKALKEENERLKQQISALVNNPSNNIVADAEEIVDEAIERAS